jgi:hypothetical protein
MLLRGQAWQQPCSLVLRRAQMLMPPSRVLLLRLGWVRPSLQLQE